MLTWVLPSPWWVFPFEVSDLRACQQHSAKGHTLVCMWERYRAACIWKLHFNLSTIWSLGNGFSKATRVGETRIWAFYLHLSSYLYCPLMDMLTRETTPPPSHTSAIIITSHQYPYHHRRQHCPLLHHHHHQYHSCFLYDRLSINHIITHMKYVLWW